MKIGVADGREHAVPAQIFAVDVASDRMEGEAVCGARVELRPGRVFDPKRRDACRECAGLGATNGRAH